MKGSDTERALLDAAEGLLASGDSDPFLAISFRRVGREASFSEATVRKHFPTREEFGRRLVDHMLDKMRRDAPWKGLSQLSERLADRWERLADIVIDFAEMTIQPVSETRRLGTQLRLWNYLDHLPDVRGEIEDSAIQRDRQLENFLNKFFSDHADIVRRRTSWLSSRELAAVIGALADGIAIRSRTSCSSQLSQETVAKVIAALLAASIETDDCEHGPLGTLSYVDEIRRSSPTPTAETSLW